MSNEFTPLFQDYRSAEDYERANVKGVCPMTAKEIESEEEQDKLLNSRNYYVEEKFDGTRATLHFYKEQEYERYSDDLTERLREDLMTGTMIVEGKLRVYTFFKSNDSPKERIDFLKKEYGQAGHSHELGFVDYSSNGITFNNYKTNDSNVVTWGKVAKEIENLIDMGLYLPKKAFTRCFSRRISEKTKWYCENTDSLPHLRDLEIPDIAGTIIDGEMFIPNRPFKDVSATLNCNWDKAIDRQKELGQIVFHAFDIMYYKGICIEHLPLEIRKHYLIKVVQEINSPYVELVKFYDKEVPISIKIGDVESLTDHKDQFSTLYSEVIPKLKKQGYANSFDLKVSHKAYYEYIVMTGGEGVILKPKSGKYLHKRGREYQKIKKFLTREVIILDFAPPEDSYKGKFPTPDKWDYWESYEHDIVDLSDLTTQDRKRFKDNSWNKDEWRPISKFYANGWVGNIRYGVTITDEEIAKLPKNKKFNIENTEVWNKETYDQWGEQVKVIEVGECAGFDEPMRQYFSDHKEEMIGQVIEVKCNELFKDTGKMRHPRFMRMRPDKSPLQCTWKDHINL